MTGTEGTRLKIYTKTGDKGTSSLYTGERRGKDDLIFEALGAVDELTSYLGLGREYIMDLNFSKPLSQIEKIQCYLQDLNSNVATPRNSTFASSFKINRTLFDAEGAGAKELETWIDDMDSELPPLKNFILPSGGKAASTIHVARSICRRAERRVVPLVKEGVADEQCGIYLNRLSDYLFTLGRFLSLKEGKKETIYVKPK